LKIPASFCDQLPGAVAALRHPGFRFLLSGQAVALMGTWVQGTAQRWLVLELTDSPWAVGLLGAVGGLPFLLFSFLGGWLADRVPRISVLLCAQGLVFFQALLLGILIHGHSISVLWILILVFLFGCGMAFEVPARQSLVFDLVGRDDITNAVGLHSAVFNLARFAGPAVAGLLITTGNLAGCFYFKAFSAFLIITVLIYVKRKYLSAEKLTEKPAASGFMSSTTEIFKFARGNRIVRSVILIILSYGLLLLPYSVLVPSLGRDVLGLGAGEYGFLCSANGMGALLGAVAAAIFSNAGRRERWWAGTIIFPLTIAGLGFASTIHQAAFLLFLSGIVMVTVSNSAVSLLQLEVRDSQRGRIMGLFTTGFMGLFPAGCLIHGALAELLGVRMTLVTTATAALLVILLIGKSLFRDGGLRSRSWP